MGESESPVPPRRFEPPERPRFRILAIDGGGIRGLIPALLLARIEQHLAALSPGATIASGFDLIAGTSTGGLIALALTTPDGEGRPAMSAAEIVDLYSGAEAREIFARPPLRRLPVLGGASDLLDPRYGLDGLERVLERRLGREARLADALSEVLVTTYDMRSRTPRFLKRWGGTSGTGVVEAGLATAAAPTYFPALRLDDGAFVDGGVFANNPTIAAVIEALKRREGGPLRAEDLLVVSLGTGHHETGFEPDQVAGWGSLGWILPSGGSEPPLIGAMLDGQSDSADHWAHVLLNHEPGTEPARGPELGAGPRYFRWQVELAAPLPLDGVEPEETARLRARGDALADARAAEIEAVAGVLVG